jgi:enoyl-CoA hydratase/carnithine racemase
MSEHIIVKDDGTIRTIRMNRPDKKNALTVEMYDAMAAAIEGADAAHNFRCIVIAGGRGAFSAGNDLHHFHTVGATGLSEPVLRFLHALARCETPLVAAVRGVAVGVGTTMLMHCDQVVAASDAQFSTPFVGLGLVPEAGSTLLARRLMGYSHSFALLVLGRPLDAQHALACGLVSTVVHPDDVEDTALRMAHEIAALPREALRAARRLLRGSPDEVVARIDAEAEEFKTRLASPEAKAAFAAFLNRKK